MTQRPQRARGRPEIASGKSGRAATCAGDAGVHAVKAGVKGRPTCRRVRLALPTSKRRACARFGGTDVQDARDSTIQNHPFGAHATLR
jgi:hypothetical protein